MERGDIGALREAIDWSVRPAVHSGGVDSDDGRVEFRLPFERLESAYADLVKLGGAVDVREPSELRVRLAHTGRELVARFSDGNRGLRTSAHRATAPLSIGESKSSVRNR